MISFSPALQELTTALRCLPGVGPKSAQRMAFQLLARNREGGKTLAAALQYSMEKIGHCARCRTFSETEYCGFCSNARRDAGLLCIVESPADQVAIEQIGYQGLYFVLLGHLSPIDGIGPSDLGLDQLRKQLSTSEVREIILATNPTVEGEATAQYIAQIAKQHGIAHTRIAHGVPMGSELEFIDEGTLAHAFAGREPIPMEDY